MKRKKERTNNGTAIACVLQYFANESESAKENERPKLICKIVIERLSEYHYQLLNKKFLVVLSPKHAIDHSSLYFFLFSSMTSSSTNLFFLLCVALLIRDFSDCCTDSELVRGCRISTPDFSPDFQCLCGVGCHKEFPFKTRLECEASLKEG